MSTATIIPLEEIKHATAYSVSRCDTFDQCPAILMYRAMGYSDPKGPALARGIRIHDQGEAYLKNPKSQLPKAYKYFPEEMAMLRRKKAIAEGQVAFTRNWKETTWFAKNTYVRMALDALVLQKTKAKVIDYKTGRVYPKHRASMGLYALGTFKKYPSIQKVDVELWYLDIGEIDDLSFTRKRDEAELQQIWKERGEAVIAEREYPEKLNAYCKWCNFNVNNGGPCETGRVAKR